MDKYCVIMAGGIGSRFWPLSKNNYPKQFLDILGTGKSFIRSTFERFNAIIPAENFVVVTNANYKELVLEHLPELHSDQVLCEPMRRNTAPCIAYATYHILSHSPQANIVVTPADHLVTNEAEFQRIINLGFDFTERNRNALMTIGIRPSRPETGYVYIEVETHSSDIVPVKNFKEKPDLPTAQQFVADGRYYWNSGIFIWSAEAIMSALSNHLPALVSLFDEGKNLFGTPDEQTFINRQFERCENISIDYGVMEHSNNRYTIAADFGWSDIGTWGSLYTHAQHDSANNALSGHILTVDTTSSVINIEPGYEAIVQGLDNYLIALRNHSLLVCRLDDEQQIKHWVEALS